LLQSPFEYEYEYRYAEYEYEEVGENAIALLSVLLRDLRVSVRGFFGCLQAENSLTALPTGTGSKRPARIRDRW
jgi:hypothetical protein